MFALNDSMHIVDAALYLKDTLVISDVHIGYEEALNRQGILIPRTHFQEIMERMNGIFSSLKDHPVKEIIINGDLKHEFGRISETEWRHTLRFLDLLLSRAGKVILVQGNHDSILGPIAEKRGIMIEREVSRHGCLFLHGDIIPQKVPGDIGCIVIGHEHPAVTLRKGARAERYKCFLKGRWKRKDLIVMPSFSPLAEGTDILEENRISPFLGKGIDRFRVLIIGDDVYDFGTVRDIARGLD